MGRKTCGPGLYPKWKIVSLNPSVVCLGSGGALLGQQDQVSFGVVGKCQ